jgi:hypothetical protein
LFLVMFRLALCLAFASSVFSHPVGAAGLGGVVSSTVSLGVRN